MLFVLAIGPLYLLFYKAQQSELLKKFSARNNILVASLYADDAPLFIHPAQRELEIIDFILQLFASASGLNTNMSKAMYFPLHCQNINLDFLAEAGRVVSSWPCTYLGLPIGTRKPSRAMLHELIQKVAKRLSGWKGRFLTFHGRELLVKSVLSAIPTHFLTYFKKPQWAISGVDKFRRGFLWKDADPDHVRGCALLGELKNLFKTKILRKAGH
jgi:hypothetical protein